MQNYARSFDLELAVLVCLGIALGDGLHDVPVLGNLSVLDAPEVVVARGNTAEAALRDGEHHVALGEHHVAPCRRSWPRPAWPWPRAPHLASRSMVEELPEQVRCELRFPAEA